MTGEQKMFVALFVCVAMSVSAIAASLAYYHTTVDAEAIKAGLIQKRSTVTPDNRIVFHSPIWVKPEPE